VELDELRVQIWRMQLAFSGYHSRLAVLPGRLLNKDRMKRQLVLWERTGRMVEQEMVEMILEHMGLW
jgi:hypothetical protein